MSEPIGCSCEPCPIDLSVLFPGARIFYEDPAFTGTKCKWHWVVRFEKAKHLEVGPSGDGTLWVDGLPQAVTLGGEHLKPTELNGNYRTCEADVCCARELDRRYRAIRK